MLVPVPASVCTRTCTVYLHLRLSVPATCLSPDLYLCPVYSASYSTVPIWDRAVTGEADHSSGPRDLDGPPHKPQPPPRTALRTALYLPHPKVSRSPPLRIRHTRTTESAHTAGQEKLARRSHQQAPHCAGSAACYHQPRGPHMPHAAQSLSARRFDLARLQSEATSRG